MMKGRAAQGLQSLLIAAAVSIFAGSVDAGSIRVEHAHDYDGGSVIIAEESLIEGVKIACQCVVAFHAKVRRIVIADGDLEADLPGGRHHSAHVGPAVGKRGMQM